MRIDFTFESSGRARAGAQAVRSRPAVELRVPLCLARQRRRRSTSSSSSSIAARRTWWYRQPETIAAGRLGDGAHQEAAPRIRLGTDQRRPAEEHRFHRVRHHGRGRATADRYGSTSCASRRAPPARSPGAPTVTASTSLEAARTECGARRRSVHRLAERRTGPGAVVAARLRQAARVSAAWSSTGARTTTRSLRRRGVRRRTELDHRLPQHARQRTPRPRLSARRRVALHAPGAAPEQPRPGLRNSRVARHSARARRLPQSIHRGHRQGSTARHISALLLAPADVLDRGRRERR